MLEIWKYSRNVRANLICYYQQKNCRPTRGFLFWRITYSLLLKNCRSFFPLRITWPLESTSSLTSSATSWSASSWFISSPCTIISPHQCHHHHSYHPSPRHSSIPSSKLSYFSNPTLHRHLAPLRTDFTDTRTALRLFSPFQWACQNFQCKSSIVSYRIVFSPDPANKLAWKNVKFALVKLHIFSITAIYSIRVTFNYCRVSSSDDVVSVSGQILTPYVQILSRFGVETITRLQQMGGRRESQACSQ